MAVLPVVKLPTAPAPIGSERPHFTLLALASFGFGRVGVDFNAGLAALGQRDPDGYLLQASLVGTAAVDVTDRLKLLGELFFASRAQRDAGDVVGAVAGAIYMLTRDVAIDCAVITALGSRRRGRVSLRMRCRDHTNPRTCPAVVDHRRLRLRARKIGVRSNVSLDTCDPRAYRAVLRSLPSFAAALVSR